MPIFKQFHKFVIGKGGATIKQIRQDTNAKVDLPASGSDSDIIVLTGRKDDVLKAQKIIQQIQSEQADVVSTTIPRDVIAVFAVSISPATSARIFISSINPDIQIFRSAATS